MNGINWGFRDLTTHLFPGLIVCAVLAFIGWNEGLMRFDNPAFVIFAFLIISYVIGFFVDSIAKIRRWADRLIRFFKKDPLDIIFKSKNKNGKNFGFNILAYKLIESKIGREFVELEEDRSLLHYMSCEIASKSSNLALMISRVSALENMCRNLSFCSLISALILAVYFLFSEIGFLLFGSLLFAVMSVLLILAQDAQRSWFSRVVIVSYVSINSD